MWPALAGLGLGIGMVVVAGTDAVVGNTPSDMAGVGGGIQGTAVQLGGVLGTSVLGSILASQAGRTAETSFSDAGVPADLASGLAESRDVISQGLAPIPSGTPANVAAAITDGAHAAFMSGFHSACLVSAALALVGAALAPLIRAGETTTEQVAHV